MFIFLNAFDSFNAKRYQAAGVENIYAWLKKMSKTPLEVNPSQIDLWGIIEKYYPHIKAYNNEIELVYPWTFDRMREVFDVKHTSIPDNCIGIHWYAGDSISQKYNNILTEANYKHFDNTYCYFADKILNGQGVPSTAACKKTEGFECVAAEIHNMEGVDLLNQGDIEGARAAFLRSVEADPDFAIAHNNLGLVSYYQSEYKDALKHFEKASELQPFDQTIAENMGKASGALKYIS